MERAIVFYDLDCGFCRWSLAKLLRLDRARRLRPAPIQSPEGAKHLAQMSDAARLASWHLVVEDGTIHSGGAAVAPLLELLSGGRLPAAVFRRFPGLTNRGYRWVAGHRTALAKPLSGRAVRRATARIDAHAR